MKKFYIIALVFISHLGVSQVYQTPGTGVKWSLNDIANDRPDTMMVDEGVYTLIADMLISTSDTLEITESELIWQLEEGVRVTVEGALLISGDMLITSVDSLAPFDGFRLEAGAHVHIANMHLTHSGGIRVLTDDFSLLNSLLENNVSGVSTGSVVSFSTGAPVIVGNTFRNNATPALSSGANSGVSGIFRNNYIVGNNTDNANRPQINMGVTDGENTLVIQDNIIEGNRSLDRVGGIGISNFIGGEIDVIIENNTIFNNRYGVSILGNNVVAEITNNEIYDNNTEGIPLQGGSGITLNTSAPPMDVKVFGNSISGNLWGITVIGEASVHLGDEDEGGYNLFSENGNGGETYALYNNTGNTISAQNNCWTGSNDLEAAEEVIYHKNDDDTLGEVIYDPIFCVVNTTEVPHQDITIYPNPTRNMIHIPNRDLVYDQAFIYDINGSLLSEWVLPLELNTIEINVLPGMYIVELRNDQSSQFDKLIIH